MKLDSVVHVLSDQLAARGPLADLAPRTRAVLIAVGESCIYAPGQFLQTQGEEASHCFVLLRGQVKMRRTSGDGGEIVPTIFTDGDVFNVVPALGRRQSDADLIAVTPAHCIKLSRDSVLGLIQSEPEVLGHLLPVLMRQMVECGNCMVDSVRHRVEVRFANLFLKLSDRLGVEHPDGVFLPLVLSRKDLAGMLGTTIETCIRIMSRWSQQGLIDTVADGFLIRDCEALELLSSD